MDRTAAQQNASRLSAVKDMLGGQWDAVMQLVQLAGEHGMAVYLVGGQVRDLLLTQARAHAAAAPVRPDDVDLVVEGDAPMLARLAVASLGGAQVIGDNEFLTARWQPDAGPGIDLATARTESYAAPAALPVVRPAALRQDLSRRDFSVNAMALGLGKNDAGTLHDPYGGAADLRCSLLRVLHAVSFYDDPTRMLRAARFAARFNLTLHVDTQAQLTEALAAQVLDKLSPARLGAELHLVLDAPQVLLTFRLLHRWGILRNLNLIAADAGALMAALSAGCTARERLQIDVGPAVPSQAAVLWLVLAMRLPATMQQTAGAWMRAGGAALRRMRTGPQKVRAALQALDGAVAGRRNASLAGLDDVERTVLFAQVLGSKHEATLLWWEKTGRHVRTVVTGHTLLARGHAPGPGMQRALAAALAAAQSGAGASGQLAAAEAALAPAAPAPG
jgi:tRNA nucleotidyltransferase (CCA-adding enzyme)